MTNELPKLSLVIPVFNEEAVLPELFTRLTKLFDENATSAWSAVLVNDGSRDRSLEILRSQAARDPRFVAVELSRNFGFQAAISAGLAEALDRGAEAVVTMDADLQDPPELILEMLAKWREGAEVVLAVRRSRQEKGLRRIGMDLFHAFFGAVADLRMDSNTGTFSLLDRIAASAVCQLPERNRFFPGLRTWVGFKTAEVLYDRQERAAGQPQQTLLRLLRYALDGVFSFSYLPLRLLTYTGVFVSAAGFVIGSFFVIRRLLGVEIAQTGFTTLVTLVLFLGGVQLIGIGILGEYLARVYDEVKQRPPYIVRRPRQE
jgi:polyisoprenyl-phosphate glycosyltransferase